MRVGSTMSRRVPFAGRFVLEKTAYALHRLAQVFHSEAHGHLAGLNLADIEDGIDQPDQAFAGGDGFRQGLALIP